MLIAIAAAGWLLAQSAAVPPTTTVTAAPATPAAAAAAKPEKPKKPKLICTTETQTDTIIPRRICRTPEQIEAQRRNAEGIMRCEGITC